MPRIGVMPFAVACRWNSAAANMLPWSVIATCVIPCAWTSLNSSLSLAAPSSIEYSVCTCRWANGPCVGSCVAIGDPPPPGTLRTTQPHRSLVWRAACVNRRRPRALLIQQRGRRAWVKTGAPTLAEPTGSVSLPRRPVAPPGRLPRGRAASGLDHALLGCGDLGARGPPESHRQLSLRYTCLLTRTVGTNQDESGG